MASRPTSGRAGRPEYPLSMSSNTGALFRVSTFGESHGVGVGVVVDGCPARLPLDEETVQKELDRRRPGQSRITTQRKEGDRVEIMSGVHEGITLGTPIAMMVRNEDQRSRDYDEMREKYRPSHADYGYDQKYGVRAPSGGGRASARETIGRVAAGAVAKVLLASLGVEVVAWVSTVGELTSEVDSDTVGRGRGGEHRSLPRLPRRRADAGADRGDPQGRELHRRHDLLRRARGPRRVGRAGVRQAGGRPGEGGSQPARLQGVRGRKRLWGDAPHRAGAQRRLRGARRPRDHRNEPVGRHPGGHLEWDADPVAGRLQADGDDHVASGHGNHGPRGDKPARARATRPLRPSRARSPWSRRWSRWS